MLKIKAKPCYAGNSWVTGARKEHAKLPVLKYYLLLKVWIQQHERITSQQATMTQRNAF